jgi:tetratricopeptide (TPR) repeat protein
VEPNASKSPEYMVREFRRKLPCKVNSTGKTKIISAGLKGKDFELIYYDLEKAHKDGEYSRVVEYGREIEDSIGFKNIEDPMLYIIVFYLFYSFQKIKQPEKALKLYEKLSSATANYLLRDDYEIFLKLSAFYYFLKRHEDAIPVLLRAKKLYPHDFNILYSFGIQLFESRKFKEAEPNFEKANKIRPNDVDVMLYLGMTYHEISKFHEAVTTLKEADNIKSNDASILAALGSASLELGKSEEAEKALKTANKLCPDDLNLFLNLSRAYIQNDKYHDAENVLLKARTVFPDNFTILSLLRIVHEKRKMN